MTDPLHDTSLWDWVVLSREPVAHLVREDKEGRTVVRCGILPPGNHRRSKHQDALLKCWLCQKKPAEQLELLRGEEKRQDEDSDTG